MQAFKPHIAPKTKMREFTLRAILLGCILSTIFGVGNAYLGLKVGMTISASIPAAVLSMVILRTFFKRSTILENNLVQTVASVGEGLAAGVIFTAPALFILGDPPSIFRIFLLSLLGGVLGVLLMIPMRRFLIVEEHGKLPYPEGVACASILKSGEEGRHKAKLALLGIAVGSVYKICSGAMHLFREVETWSFPKTFRTQFSIDCTPALLGVGFIIGPRIASLLFVGGIMGWWVIIPLIAKFGAAATIFPGITPVDTMTPSDIWSNYVRYIGAGAIAVGGLASLFRILPMLGKTFRATAQELFKGARHRVNLSRTDQDISLRWLVLGPLAIILTLWLFPGMPMNFLTILLLVILGFFFICVTSITVGLVGSSSSPVSGMTITTLLVTCLIFVAIGWTERVYLISALTMAVVVNITIALACTTSQDLKTGYLLGATPKWQQIGEIIGTILPAIVIGGVLYVLNATYKFGSPELPAPQGTLMALIANGVISGDIPLGLVIVGAVLGLIFEILGLPVLAFAIGLYLPLSLSTSVMVGGIVSWLVRRRGDEQKIERGILAASGLVAGDACTGVVIAFLTIVGLVSPEAKALLPDYIGLFLFALMGFGLMRVSMKKHPLG